MKGCADKGKGHCVFVRDNENSSKKIIQLLIDSFSPVISKMSLGFDKDIVESVVPNPESMPYFLKNEIVNFYVTFKGHIDRPIHFSLSYEDSFNKLPHKTDIAIDPKDESE